MMFRSGTDSYLRPPSTAHLIATSAHPAKEHLVVLSPSCFQEHTQKSASWQMVNAPTLHTRCQNTLLQVRSSSYFHGAQQQQGNWSTWLQQSHSTILCSVSASRMFLTTVKHICLLLCSSIPLLLQDEVQDHTQSISGMRAAPGPSFQSYQPRLSLTCPLAQTLAVHLLLHNILLKWLVLLTLFLSLDCSLSAWCALLICSTNVWAPTVWLEMALCWNLGQTLQKKNESRFNTLEAGDVLQDTWEGLS